jgi:hypothetical protein
LILGRTVKIPEPGETLSVGNCAKGASWEWLLVKGCPQKRGDHENTKEVFPLSPSTGPF